MVIMKRFIKDVESDSKIYNHVFTVIKFHGSTITVTGRNTLEIFPSSKLSRKYHSVNKYHRIPYKLKYHVITESKQVNVKRIRKEIEKLYIKNI